MATPRENKLAAFFRSRSRSRPRPQPADPPQDDPPVPRLDPPKSSLRPISSTTTATHSTITPLPSDALRNRPAPRHAYARHDPPSDTCLCDSDDNHIPRSETPSSTRRKLAWHSLFGISLSRRSSSPHQPSPDRQPSSSTSASEYRSPRKRSFRLTSRPTTPKSVESSSSKSPYSIPTPSSPLPLSASPRRRSFGLASQRSTPRSSTGHLPLPHTPQPARSHGRRHSAGSERPPHDSAVALPEEPSQRAPHKPVHDGGGRSKVKEKDKLVTDSGVLPPPLFPPEPSRHLPRHPGFPNLPTVDSASSEENDQLSHRLQIPQIIHTPPTPQRPGEEVEFPSQSNASLPRVDSAAIPVAKGKTPAIAHREQLLVSDSQSHPEPPPRGRFTPRFLTSKDARKGGDGQKSGRRPADGLVQKACGPSRNMTSHRSKLGSFDFERPVSGLNRSNSTVDRQKSHGPVDNTSHSRARHPLEQTTSHDTTRDDKSNTDHPESPMPTGDASVISFSSVSLQTKSTGVDIPPGQSSSWGRASGRRILRTSHGTFAFEQPSSLPNSPNPHTFNLPNEPLQNGRREHTPSATPLRAMFDGRAKHSRGQSSDQPSPGERKSKGKGRSLDLGLGLSWAPSRLREDVLMPGLMLTREKAKLEKSRANGLDVTKTFESLLSESRFQTFKKYVRRFDAHTIPLEGPSGLLARVENLLAESGLGEQERSKLMSEFTVFVENHGG